MNEKDSRLAGVGEQQWFYQGAVYAGWGFKRGFAGPTVNVPAVPGGGGHDLKRMAYLQGTKSLT